MPIAVRHPGSMVITPRGGSLVTNMKTPRPMKATCRASTSHNGWRRGRFDSIDHMTLAPMTKLVSISSRTSAVSSKIPIGGNGRLPSSLPRSS
jgi:hypothetical protein